MDGTAAMRLTALRAASGEENSSMFELFCRGGPAIATVRCPRSGILINADATTPASRRPARILVAEDEPDIRELLALLLESEGYEVVSVVNGREAVEAAAHSDFSLATRCTMPLLNGLQAAAMLVAHPALKIALHTAMEQNWIRTRFTAPHTYFRKPLQPEAFLATVAPSLSRISKGLDWAHWGALCHPPHVH